MRERHAVIHDKADASAVESSDKATPVQTKKQYAAEPRRGPSEGHSYLWRTAGQAGTTVVPILVGTPCQPAARTGGGSD